MLNPENKLVVVNISKWSTDFSEHHMYCCPATLTGFKPNYKHTPAKYIGNYVFRGAKYIAVVAACVRLNVDGPDEVLWKFDDISDADAILKAESLRKITNRQPRPCLVFLQSQLSVTDFKYDFDGGMLGSNAYFDLTELEVTGVKDLAVKLRETPWSALAKSKI